jgi:hypothetical protein
MPVVGTGHRGEGGGAEQTQVVYIPLELPLDSARHAPWNGAWIQLCSLKCRMNE